MVCNHPCLYLLNEHYVVLHSKLKRQVWKPGIRLSVLLEDQLVLVVFNLRESHCVSNLQVRAEVQLENEDVVSVELRHSLVSFSVIGLHCLLKQFSMRLSFLG